MYLITYYRYGYGDRQMERVESDKVSERVAELQTDWVISEIEVWKKQNPTY